MGSTCAKEDWEIFSESICSGLDRYFRACSADLAALSAVDAPEGICVEASDLFDGRLYRHIFYSIISIGLEEKKCKVDSKHLAFEAWAEEELSFLWSKAATGAKD